MPNVPEISISVGDPLLPSGGVQSNFGGETNPELNGTLYYGFGVTSFFMEDEGLRGLPLATKKGEGRSAVYRIHGGQVYKVVTFVCQSVESPPMLPHPDTQNPNEILMRKAFGVPQSGVLPDGKRLWTHFGQYLYLLRKPLADSDPRFAGTSPFSTRTDATRELRVTDFTRGLIAPSTPPAGYNLTTIGF